jgi:hypothetical protein
MSQVPFLPLPRSGRTSLLERRAAAPWPSWTGLGLGWAGLGCGLAEEQPLAATGDPDGGRSVSQSPRPGPSSTIPSRCVMQ